MGQVLHGSATTTEAARRAIQNSQESLRALSKRHGINPKTVAKWKKRTSTADLPTGPKGMSRVVGAEMRRASDRRAAAVHPGSGSCRDACTAITPAAMMASAQGGGLPR